MELHTDTGRPATFGPNTMFSRIVFHGNSEYCWNTMPRSGPGPVTGSSSTVTLPLVSLT